MLIVFSGLPGVGKTTLARALAGHREAVFLRIDTIEQAIRRADLAADVGAAGYDVAMAIAEENLRQGREVVADCVNPVAASRLAWAEVAGRAGVALVDVEVVCSIVERHRWRVETREADIAGHVLPDWAAVVAREYEPWTTERLVVDTATLSVAAVLGEVCAYLAVRWPPP